MPFIQVYAYEVRLLGRETLRVGFRPVVAPDVEHPFLIDHDYGMLVEDKLQITTSAEGLLEYIGYQREPKAIEAAAVVARAALSLAAPLPMGLKGEDGLPEFSRLVFKTNIVVSSDGKARAEFNIGGRHFQLQGEPLHKAVIKPTTQNVLDPKAQVVGIHHRPLMPITVSITERSGPNDTRATRREVMSVEATRENLGRENALLNSINDPNLGSGKWKLDLKEYDDRKASVLDIGNLTDEERNRIDRQLNPDPNVPPALKKSIPNNLIGVTFKEAPIAISDIVYVPNPTQIDTFFLPSTIFAPQAYELSFAGGSIYDVKVHRKSEVLAFANGVSDFAGSFVRIPANLFTFTVVHEEKSGGGAFGSDAVGGSKDTGDYRKKQDKDPGDYRRKVDKD